MLLLITNQVEINIDTGHLGFALFTSCLWCVSGLFGCLQVVLQVGTYITAIEVAAKVTVVQVVATCISVFGLGFASGN